MSESGQVKTPAAAAGGELPKTVLVTGGAGYIGSHTVLELVADGFDVIIVDNFVNSSRECLRRLEELLDGRKLTQYNVDVARDCDGLERVFREHAIGHVIHFAALKAVGESVALPLEYYYTNVVGTLNLLQTMEKFHVHSFVFSSSATVYGTPKYLPLDERHPTGESITNPYGQTKHMVEQILRDACVARPELWRVVVLRYFNPVGAHASGRIGENPSGVPNNLMPFVAQVAVGRRPEVKVYGNDYDTPDGTGVRDYIHVVDLASGHLAALKKLSVTGPGFFVYNLGTGRGYSVLEMVAALAKASGRDIPHVMAPRRLGDLGTVYADTTLAEQELGWRAERGLEEMCVDLWRWQSSNPNGFD